jgi:hypothetical protein
MNRHSAHSKTLDSRVAIFTSRPFEVAKYHRFMAACHLSTGLIAFKMKGSVGIPHSLWCANRLAVCAYAVVLFALDH